MSRSTETQITCEDAVIIATIRCSCCGRTEHLEFGGEAPSFDEKAMGDCFADERWTIDEEWYEENGDYHARQARCGDCEEEAC